MKRVVLYSALALLLGAIILRTLQHDAGYVLIVIAGKTIEMRFWFAVFVALGSVLLLMWLVRLIYRVVGSINNGWSLAMANKSKRGAARTTSGLLQFIEGDWLEAKKTLLHAAKDVDAPLVHYLGAARSAYETGDFAQAESLIKKAEKVAPNNRETIAISQARMLFLNNQYEACLRVLHGVKTSVPNHPVVLNLLHKSYLAVKDWSSLELLLPLLEKNNVLTDVKLFQLQVQVYLKLLEAAGHTKLQKVLPGPHATSPAPSPQSDAQATLRSTEDALELVWHRVPKSLRQTPELVGLYSKILLKMGRVTEVERLLCSTLKSQWSEALVGLYGLTNDSDSKKQLRSAESWLNQHPLSAALHLALGRICLRCGLWGQAKDYFQSSLRLQAAPTTYAELARLQAALGEHEQSRTTNELGLLSASDLLPDLPLPT